MTDTPVMLSDEALSTLPTCFTNSTDYLEWYEKYAPEGLERAKQQAKEHFND